MRRKLLTLFILVFWLLTSNTYAIDLWFTKGTNWNVIPKWVSNRTNFYYCSRDGWIYIEKCSPDSPWAFGISGYVIGGYSSDFFMGSYGYWQKYEQIWFKWFWFEYENEGITYYQARYKWAVQYYNTFTIPSRTAYQYTNSIGNKFLFSEILVYDNQFTLYDPNTRYWVSWIGDVRLENMMLIANPRKEEQNVFLIQLQKMKAFSLTVDKNQAREIWKGNWVNKNFLKNLQFEKSYTLTDWGDSLFPTWFKSWNQRINFIYTEDIELQSMDWWGGTTNNQWGNSDGSYKERLAEYNQCASYWQNVKTYTLYDRECYRWLLDDPADNRDFDVRLAPWKAIVDWNWEGELDIKTKDPICLKFKSRKPVYMQKYKDKRDEFIKDSQEYWLNPSQTINVAEKCGTRPVPIKQAEEKSWLWLIAEKASNLIDGFKEKRKNEKDRMGQNWSDWKRFFNWTYEYYEWGKVGTWPLWIIKEMRKEAWLSWELWWFLWVLDDLANNFKKWQDFYPKFNVCSKKPISKERDYILIIPFMLIIFYLLKIMR